MIATYSGAFLPPVLLLNVAFRDLALFYFYFWLERGGVVGSVRRLMPRMSVHFDGQGEHISTSQLQHEEMDRKNELSAFFYLVPAYHRVSPFHPPFVYAIIVQTDWRSLSSRTGQRSARH